MREQAALAAGPKKKIPLKEQEVSELRVRREGEVMRATDSVAHTHPHPLSFLSSDMYISIDRYIYILQTLFFRYIHRTTSHITPPFFNDTI